MSDGRKFRLIKPGVMSHFCQGCGIEHTISLSDLDKNGHRVGWNGSFTAPSFGGPVSHKTGRGTCSYELRGGVLHFGDDCWHPLAGKAVHLEEIK